MPERHTHSSARPVGTERRVVVAGTVAAAGTIGGLAALISASACCVLPFALASIGIGSGGLAVFVPYRWPLAALALVVVMVGWIVYIRRHRACSVRSDCTASASTKATLAALLVASTLVTVSLLWDFIEQPLQRALGGL